MKFVSIKSNIPEIISSRLYQKIRIIPITMLILFFTFTVIFNIHDYFLVTITKCKVPMHFISPIWSCEIVGISINFNQCCFGHWKFMIYYIILYIRIISHIFPIEEILSFCNFLHINSFVKCICMGCKWHKNKHRKQYQQWISNFFEMYFHNLSLHSDCVKR